MDHSSSSQVIVCSHVKAADCNDPPPYLKLVADCWEHIFEYLEMLDIFAMGQTCKRMNRMAGYYFREYFPEIRYVLKDGRIRVWFSHAELRTDFYPSIRDLKVESALDSFLDEKTYFSLKTLRFYFLYLLKPQIRYYKNVLKNIEKIEIYYCHIGDPIFEQLANYCPKLKHLRVSECWYSSNGRANEVFLKYYPTLEHMEYESNKASQMTELKVFLEKHSKLKHFECQAHWLWANRDLIKETHAQLNLLTIDIRKPKMLALSDQFVDFLKQLHERGFYKALNFKHNDSSNKILNSAIQRIPSALEILEIRFENMQFDVSRLINLKDLRISEIDDVLTEFAVKSLAKLQQLTFSYVYDICGISQFIRHSTELEVIRIYYLRDNNPFDFFSLNEERKKLANARKILIYVQEYVYLREKWKSTNLNLSHIKLVRIPLKPIGMYFYE